MSKECDLKFKIFKNDNMIKVLDITPRLKYKKFFSWLNKKMQNFNMNVIKVDFPFEGLLPPQLQDEIIGITFSYTRNGHNFYFTTTFTALSKYANFDVDIINNARLREVEFQLMREANEWEISQRNKTKERFDTPIFDN